MMIKRCVVYFIISCVIFFMIYSVYAVEDKTIKSQPKEVKQHSSDEFQGYEILMIRELAKLAKGNFLAFILMVLLYLDLKGWIDIRGKFQGAKKENTSNDNSNNKKSYVEKNTLEELKKRLVYKDIYDIFINNIAKELSDISTKLAELGKHIPNLIEQNNYRKGDIKDNRNDIMHLQDNWKRIDVLTTNIKSKTNKVIQLHNHYHPGDAIDVL